MRVSDMMMYQNLAQNINQAQSAYVQTQQEVSSGLAISQPSDNPAGTTVVLQIETARQQVKSWQGNANAALNQMQTTDTAMTGIQNSLTAAVSLAVQSLSGSTNPTDQANMSKQAQGILSQVQNLANTQYDGTYVFSGVSQAPTVTTTGTYNAAATSPTQKMEIGAGVQVPVTVDGNQVFNTAPTGQPPTSTLLNVLSNLSLDLQAGNTAAIQADLGELQAQEGALGSSQATLGADMQRVQAALQQLTMTNNSLQTQQGNVQNVDMAKVIAQLTAQQTAYQAAVAAGANLKLPTLANYLS